MAITIDELFEKALTLDEDLRVELAERILETTQGPTEFDAEQLAIVERRAGEMESGLVEGISGEDVFRRVHEILSKKRLGA